MGLCGSSGNGGAVAALHDQDHHAFGQDPAEHEAKVLVMLGLSEAEGKKLYRRYHSFEHETGMTPQQGGFDMFARFMRIDTSRFNKRCFSLLGHEKGSEKSDKLKIDFITFAVCLWNICTYDQSGLRQFAFALFDTDRSGGLECKEVQKIVADVYNIRATQGGDAAVASSISLEDDPRMRDALQQIFNHSDEDGVMNLKRWEGYVAKHEMILWPVFKMQLNLRTTFFGVAFWDKHSKARRRVANLDGEEVDMTSIDAIVKAIFGVNAYQALTGRRRVTGFWTKLDRLEKKVGNSLEHSKEARKQRLGDTFEEEEEPEPEPEPEEPKEEPVPDPPSIIKDPKARRALAQQRKNKPSAGSGRKKRERKERLG